VDDADLTLHTALDRHNFETLGPGTTIGWLGRAGRWPLVARGADGRDVARDLFTARQGRIETRCALVPIMVTTQAEIALHDCLFYVAPAPTSE
jgi:hypothetical protein